MEERITKFLCLLAALHVATKRITKTQLGGEP
jgi:hypothetical protein